MDAVEFLREYRRMCDKYAYAEACGEDCSDDCPLKGFHCDVRYRFTDIENTVSKVEQWSKGRSQKTIMQDFFEKFPNAPKRLDGTPRPCPDDCGYNNFEEKCDDFDNGCVKCWNQLLEK